MLNKSDFSSFTGILTIWINPVISVSLQVIFQMIFPKPTGTQNCNLKHTKILGSTLLYGLLFPVMICMRSALGLFPGKDSLQFVCWKFFEKGTQVNTVGDRREVRAEEGAELWCRCQKGRKFESLPQQALELHRVVPPWSKGTGHHVLLLLPCPHPALSPGPTERGLSLGKAAVSSLTVYGRDSDEGL